MKIWQMAQKTLRKQKNKKGTSKGQLKRKKGQTKTEQSEHTDLVGSSEGDEETKLWEEEEFQTEKKVGKKQKIAFLGIRLLGDEETKLMEAGELDKEK